MRDEHISRAEAARRTAGIAALCGLAIAWLVALPYARVQGPQIAALLGAAMCAAVRVAAALAVADGRTGRAAWRGAVALGVVAASGWLVTRAVAVPGVAEDAGRWTSSVGLAVIVLAVAVVVLGVWGARTPRGVATLRRLVATGAVAAALAPCAGMLLVALGPAPGHHHGSAAASIGPHRFHTGSAIPSTAGFRPGFGGHAGHYVYANATRAHLPPWALALALAAAGVVVSTTRGAPRPRAAPEPGQANLAAPAQGVGPAAAAHAGPGPAAAPPPPAPGRPP